jgi:probable rRNA maturation factor
LLINVHSSQKDLKLSKKAVRRLVQAVLEYLGSSHTEVSVYFVTQAKICTLHEQFFKDPSPTDCISFPLDDEHLGEVFVCPKAALDFNAEEPYAEVALYVIHGLLHCLGFDDLEPAKKRAMRKKEKSCMALINKLGIKLTL